MITVKRSKEGRYRDKKRRRIIIGWNVGIGTFFSIHISQKEAKAIIKKLRRLSRG